MSLRLVIEHAPHPQPQAERLHAGGDLTIGRGADCDWQLDDPDMFISRKHCVIAGQGEEFTVTDSSRGGLFLDGSDRPLGAGMVASLQNGTRLKLGDLIIRVEILRDQVREAAPTQPTTVGIGSATPARAAPLPAGFDADDFFSPRPTTPAPPRPEGLPQPFERGPAPFSEPVVAKPVARPLFDDPFTLDPVATPRPQVEAAPAAALDDFNFGFGDVAAPPAAIEPDEGRARVRSVPDPAQVAPPPVPERPVAPPTVPEPPPMVRSAPTLPSDPAAVSAFFAGLGLSASDLPEGGSPAEMEALGRRFRKLAEGLVMMLRTRAREKSSVRVAQTVIGAADVNPLKFLPTTDEAVSALVVSKGKGYLGPDEAITAALRDLSDHQMRSWTALQSSLRAMIDRFDPAAFEAEVETGGMIKSLMSGSRSARLWQLYEERYRDIAKSAEDRFLGDVGADFRDAYDGKEEKPNV